jgi:hypothetical protein
MFQYTKLILEGSFAKKSSWYIYMKSEFYDLNMIKKLEWVIWIMKMLDEINYTFNRWM